LPIALARTTHVTAVSDVSLPVADTVDVQALLAATTEDEARQRSEAILTAAASCGGNDDSDWSRTGWWCGTTLIRGTAYVEGLSG
jgi:hypothetical protein